MIPSWLVIGVVAILVGYLFNQILPDTYKSPRHYEWFRQLRRPQWLTFEKLIPSIWISIFISGIGSATVISDLEMTSSLKALWLIGYGILECLILAYMPILCGLRSLRAGVVLGATGWVWGCLLALGIWPVSQLAVYLLAPYLVWSPVGTYVTWVMIQLNPADA